MDDFELELKIDFLNESEELLNSAEDAFLRLEQERKNEKLINEIFRLAHNLKGTSRAVGFDQLAELTHVAENLILKLKDNEIAVSDSVVSVLLEFKDKVHEIVLGLKENLDNKFNIEGIKEKLELATNNSPKMHFDENEVEVEEKINTVDLLSVPYANAFEEESSAEPEPEVEIKPKIVASENSSLNSSDESIRVKLSRIDKINNVVGELVILQTVISQRRFEFIKDDLTNKSIGMMGKLFKEVQEISMSLRMLPIKTTFQKMTRIVRDTAKSLNKEVKLVLVGDETEVDKTVLEHIADPLVHIMRNAVDHGIETPQERIQSGKSAQGEVELKAYHEGSNLVIQITDDGRGIDPEVLRQKAIAKKIISANAELAPSKILALIFHPGFSTKENVTEVSGRGVGMDVVKTNIESLGGEVKILSKFKHGSSFKIILPLTLAIIDGIIIRAQNQKFVIPLSQVFELTSVLKKDIKKFSAGPTLMKIRGDVLPIFYLNTKLGIIHQENETQIVIIVKDLNYKFGIVVDDIVNQQQIVIKKLGEDIKNKKGIMGSAIMGDGRPSFIIDLFEFFRDDLKQNKAFEKLKRMDA